MTLAEILGESASDTLAELPLPPIVGPCTPILVTVMVLALELVTSRDLVRLKVAHTRAHSSTQC